MKEIITSMIVEEFYKLAVKASETSPLRGTPLESMAILESLNNSSKILTEELRSTRNVNELSDQEIDDLIKDAYNTVYDKFFE